MDNAAAPPSSGAAGKEMATAGALPDDLLDEILLRLPARSILRCRAVCKAWRSRTSHPYFLEPTPPVPGKSPAPWCTLLHFPSPNSAPPSASDLSATATATRRRRSGAADPPASCRCRRPQQCGSLPVLLSSAPGTASCVWCPVLAPASFALASTVTQWRSQEFFAG
ncbi:hypothetical protein OsI_11720 [Oryza sativa Indica Group]|uniref:F-box domain-containing protein n=1 Tax=Oryza sativa subsp. indica TaxID=39946 RepID=A2XH45_ORYSI|nr:hypothetical protein OsI_11720 [Oryza sativa Indica Group]